MYYLGLDASTSAVGWAVLDSDENLIEHGTLSLKKIDTGMVDKAQQLRYTLQEIKQKYNIISVGIEDILQKTSAGSAHTICVLAGFNGITQFLCNDIFGFKAKLVKFSDARKLFGIKHNKEEKSKITAFKYISNIYDNFVIKYNRNNNITDETYDSSDAVVIAKYISRTKDETGSEGKTVGKKIRKLQKNR